MAISRPHAMRFIVLIILLLFTVFFFVPIIWLFLAPTKTDGQLLTESPFAFGSLSTLAHTFHRIVTYDGNSILIWLKNSAIYSFGGTALAVLAAIPAGYGLALTHFIGRRTLLTITLVVMIMPATALVLPLFLEINKLGLYGTIWSLILPFGFFPFGVYLAYIYFSSTIPKDLLAAARIDGATEWGVFRHIALPLARPVIGLVGFFAFVASWNNFFLPFVMTYDNSQYPLQIGLQQLIGSTASFNPANYSAGSTVTVLHRPDLAMAVIIAIAPVLIVFLFAQRTLVSGMLAGATKESWAYVRARHSEMASRQCYPEQFAVAAAGSSSEL